MVEQVASVTQVSPDNIQRNPENPRLIFRESDMNALLESIRSVGIQVPLTVYWDAESGVHVILDGERRWRCALKLNLPEVPVIIQPKPTRLGNLLMMFNIHNVRMAWDPLPMAMKLDTVRQLLIEEGKPSGVRELAAITGLSTSAIRRAYDLLNLPDKYKEMLLIEAEKTSALQEITVDLFIEIFKSLHAIQRYVPEVLKDVSEEDYIDAMVKKYRSGVTRNVIRFRDISKIARAELAGAEIKRSIVILKKLVADELYSIEQAYEDSVREAYEERELLTRIQNLDEKLISMKSEVKQRRDVIDSLKVLLSTIRDILK